jgi:phosphoesterase RecJ-like protein
MNKIALDDAVKALQDNDNFLILTHIRPDGDTLGSAAALCSALRRCGKNAALYPNKGVTERFAEYVAPYNAESIEGLDYVVSVDIADVSLFPAGWDGNVKLCIDHHESNTGFAEAVYVVPERAACGEIIIDVIKALCGNISKEEADLLYIAVSTDTGCFQYGNTNSDTFIAASELVTCGADIFKLNKAFFRTFSKSRLTLEGYIYSNMRSYDNNTINIAIVTRDMIERSGATENDMDDLASLAGRVAGNEAAVTIKETKNGDCKVSVRTGDKVNSSDICGHFGGGGHAMAAGCFINATPDEAADMLLKLIREALSA